MSDNNSSFIDCAKCCGTCAHLEKTNKLTERKIWNGKTHRYEEKMINARVATQCTLYGMKLRGPDNKSCDNWERGAQT